MNIALLGDGKTGHKIIEVLEKQGKSRPGIFNIENPPTLEKLKNYDVIISFLPGPAFLQYIDLLVESNIPVITGSTGVNWPSDINERLTKKGLKWIYASNFALGMRLIQAMIEKISEYLSLFKTYELKIHEVHHTKKLDAPSGTALSWKKWANTKVEITSERIGDVIGFHEMTLKTNTETITLSHEAHDRAIFSEGALFAAENILINPKIKAGLNAFEDVVRLTCN